MSTQIANSTYATITELEQRIARIKEHLATCPPSSHLYHESDLTATQERFDEARAQIAKMEKAGPGHVRDLWCFRDGHYTVRLRTVWTHELDRKFAFYHDLEWPRTYSYTNETAFPTEIEAIKAALKMAEDHVYDIKREIEALEQRASDFDETTWGSDDA